MRGSDSSHPAHAWRHIWSMTYGFHDNSPVSERKLLWNRCLWDNCAEMVTLSCASAKYKWWSTVLIRPHLANIWLWAALQMIWLSWAKSFNVMRRSATHSLTLHLQVHDFKNFIFQIKKKAVCSESDTLLYITANSGLLISSTSDFPTTDSNRSQKIRCDLGSQPALEIAGLQLLQLPSLLEQLKL